MNRGEIYYIFPADAVGNEIKCNRARPGVIVSNNSLTHHSGVVEVVFLTTQPKKDMPTHVTISATGVGSTALCEQINSVSVQRVGGFAGTCTEEEMAAIDKALLASLGIETPKVTESQPTEVAEPSTGEQWLIEELGKVTAERDRYAKMVNVMLQVIEV